MLPFLAGGTLSAPRIIELTTCVVDLGRHQIVREGDTVALTPLETGLLAALAETPGRTVARKDLLHRVWGYREGVVTRAVDKAVTRLRAKLLLGPSAPLDPDGEAPSHLHGVRGVGYRLDGVVRVSDDGEAPPAPDRETNVDDDLRSFVGRAEEQRLRELLARDERLISLHGPGGSGKTRLARRAGAGATELDRSSASRPAGFPGGVWFVDLTEVRAADGLLAAVAQVLGVTASADDPDRVERALRGRGRTLLILDNAEQIAAAVAELLARWTRTLRDARFLVTTRERLRIAGECCLEVEPLSEDEAVELFLARAREAGAAVDPSDREPLVRIVTLLDRMPLALELAAARVRLFGPVELAARIARDLGVLQTGRRDVSAREATLVGAIGWSWELLTGPEQAVLCQAALFAGPFALDAAEAVFEPAADAIPLLEALVDKSMVRLVHDDLARPRFALYESVRAFARARAEPSDALLRLARYAADTCERLAAATEGADGEVAFRRLLLERDNALVGFDAACDRDGDLAVRIALALQPVLAAVGPLATAERVLTEAIRLAEASGDPAMLGRARLARGATRVSLSMLDRAREDLESALTEPAVALRVRSELGHLCRLQARTAEAFGHYEVALAEAPEEGFAAAVLRGRLGRLTANVGRLDEADPHLAQALVLARRIGSTRLEGQLLSDLAWVAQARLDFAAAVDLGEEALALARLGGDRRAEGAARLTIGTAQMESGNLPAAASTLDDAARDLAAVGDRRALSIARCHVGVCRLASGDAPAAVEAVREALGLLDGVGDEVNVGVVETNLAEAHHLGGELERARDVLERALGRLRKGGVGALVGSAAGQLAAIEADRGDLDRARALSAEAERVFAEHPKPGELAILAVRRLHLRLAEAKATGDDASLAEVRDALHGPPGEPLFLALARRQLAGAWERGN